MTVTRTEIDAMEGRFRAAFVNSLPGFKPVNLIGTISKEGRTNVAIVSSVVHIGSNPPLIAFVSRPLSVERHTLQNIYATGQYTINAVTTDMVKQAHQTAARYPSHVSEFDAVGFTPAYTDGCDAPFVGESPLRIALTYHSSVEMPNETVMVIGEVASVHIADNAIHTDGAIDFSRIDGACVTGLDRYFSTRPITRLSYAKPDAPAEPV